MLPDRSLSNLSKTALAVAVSIVVAWVPELRGWMTRSVGS